MYGGRRWRVVFGIECRYTFTAGVITHTGPGSKAVTAECGPEAE